MSLSLVLLMLLIVAAVAAVPVWAHSLRWGVLPVGGVGVAMLAVIVLMLSGRI